MFNTREARDIIFLRINGKKRDKKFIPLFIFHNTENTLHFNI